MELFDYRVGQNFTGNLFYLGLGVGFRDAGVQCNFKIFALANLVEARVSDFFEGSVDGLALGIEDAFFEGNVDLSFHFCAGDGKFDYTSGEGGSGPGFAYGGYTNRPVTSVRKGWQGYQKKRVAYRVRQWIAGAWEGVAGRLRATGR